MDRSLICLLHLISALTCFDNQIMISLSKKFRRKKLVFERKKKLFHLLELFDWKIVLPHQPVCLGTMSLFNYNFILIGSLLDKYYFTCSGDPIREKANHWSKWGEQFWPLNCNQVKVKSFPFYAITSSSNCSYLTFLKVFEWQWRALTSTENTSRFLDTWQA